MPLSECLFAFALSFTFLFVTHAPLLRLPYFWDEAGYFIPAARDLLLTGSLIPHTTLSNAHPPLVMLWLAFWWKFSAFTPAVTRTAMLLVTAFALTRLVAAGAQRGQRAVAVATRVLHGALSRVLRAELDGAAGHDGRGLHLVGAGDVCGATPVAAMVFLLARAVAKETAIVAPLALLAWELACPHLGAASPAARRI